jgi:dihydrofolate reductase
MKLAPGEDYGMKDFFKSIGTTIMGSKTYEQTLHYKGKGGGMPGDCIVFTSRKFPAAKGVRFMNGDPTPLVAELRKKDKDAWLFGGGILIADFINHDLVDELSLALVPNLLGKGITLWPGLNKIYKLKLVESKNYKNGVISLKYSF